MFCPGDAHQIGWRRVCDTCESSNKIRLCSFCVEKCHNKEYEHRHSSYPYSGRGICQCKYEDCKKPNSLMEEVVRLETSLTVIRRFYEQTRSLVPPNKYYRKAVDIKKDVEERRPKWEEEMVEMEEKGTDVDEIKKRIEDMMKKVEEVIEKYEEVSHCPGENEMNWFKFCTECDSEKEMPLCGPCSEKFHSGHELTQWKYGTTRCFWQNRKQAVAKQAQECVDKGICTYSATSDNQVLQYVWRCDTCEDVTCACCVEKCHKGHNLSKRFFLRRYCGCGSGENCNALPPTPPSEE
eukprot:TRINITY_DN4495_c0_g1_i1.p1 TRINITY_DN4495_c0_g1~~TRINITY_DN4495_c0_g1_i1.p1  ORF type:complete len:294 (-),score=60.69 TRINITY_DN4495_c0_g1_i1:15-896(-)